MARKILPSDIRPMVEFEDGSTTKLVIAINGVNTNRVKIQKKSKTGVQTVLDSWDLPLCDMVTCLSVANYEFGEVASIAPVAPVAPPITPVTPEPPAPNPNPYPPGGYPKPGDSDYSSTDLNNPYNPDNPDGPYYQGGSAVITPNENDFGNVAGA